MTIDFSNISYLKQGNSKQRTSYNVLTDIDIFNILKEFKPVLAGTIPIDIDIDNSDLDIICTVTNFEKFEKILISNFSMYEDFKVEYFNDVLVCNFIVDGIEIEIYASNIESTLSNAYRHMLIEYRLLNLLGDDFKQKIISLKKGGLKTEPSFAKVLSLQGNPYEELLLLDEYSDDELLSLYTQAIKL